MVNVRVNRRRRLNKAGVSSIDWDTPANTWPGQRKCRPTRLWPLTHKPSEFRGNISFYLFSVVVPTRLEVFWSLPVLSRLNAGGKGATEHCSRKAFINGCQLRSRNREAVRGSGIVSPRNLQ